MDILYKYEKGVNIILSERAVVYVVSDSVGETAEFVVKAVATQFNGGHVDIRRHSYAEDIEDIEEVIRMARKSKSIIAYTIVSRIKEIFRPTCKRRRNFCC